MKKYILLTTLVLTPFVEAQRNNPPPHSRMLIKPKMHIPVKTTAPSPLESPRVQDKLLSLFKSSNKNSRLLGYKAVRDKFKKGELKPNDRRLYRVLIGRASDYHLGELKDHVEDITSPSALKAEDSPTKFKQFNRLYGQWFIAALNAKEMVQTDWRKVQQSGSFEGMEKEVTQCIALFEQAAKSWEKIKDSYDIKALYDTCEAINECREEISWCDGEKEFEKTPIYRMVTAAPGGVQLKQTIDRIDSFDKQFKNYANAESFNAKQAWATEQQREMVSILNKNRMMMGLECLELDKLLCKICTEHSQDMVEREFFSHTGSDGKDYEQRARDVDWNGGTWAETIYVGSADAKAVYDAWWKSEDNRPKLFEKRLNRIGVGIVNKTWTVVVGSTYEYRSKYFIVD
jgi:uncharacterized protein YkwD|tara:strand:+ start:86 stop:1288 length:1203 start_codon:yes stop_codon:yes gene_type:complete